MKKGALEEFCSKLNRFSVRELEIDELKEILFELQNKEIYQNILNPKQEDFEHFSVSVEDQIEHLAEKEMIVRNEKYMFILHSSKKMQEIRETLSHEERVLYNQMISEYIYLMKEKQKQKEQNKKLIKNPFRLK